jgi:hypothetical protein
MNFKADETVSMMKRTNEVEKYLHVGRAYWGLFQRYKPASDRNRLHGLDFTGLLRPSPDRLCSVLLPPSGLRSRDSL